MKRIALTVALASFAAAAHAAGLSPANYVQDGLVLQFDGIDNAGTGTHDPSATKWKDLKGSASIATGSGVTFGPRWLDLNFKKGSISGFSNLKLNNNPLTIDCTINLISNFTTSTSYTWPSLIEGSHLNIHSTGIMAGGSVGRSFRFYLNETEPRPYVYTIYTNTLCFISDAQSIRIFKDATISQTEASKTPNPLSWLTLNNSQANQVQFYTFRIYDRGLSNAEVSHNNFIDKVRYFAPLIEGDGSEVDWNSSAWTMDGETVPVPSNATNAHAVVRNAAVNVTASDAVGLKGLSLEDGASLKLASDAIASVRILYVEGERVGHGIYTGTGTFGTQVPWLTGTGILRVADSETLAFPETFATPAADGWFEIGNPATPSYGQGSGYSPQPTTNFHYFNGDLVTADDFSRLAYPAGAKLRLVGGLIVDTIPTARFSEIDTTNKLKYVVFRDKNIFDDGRVCVIPAGCTARFQPATWTLDSGKRWSTSAQTEMDRVGTSFYGDLEVNGTLITSLDNTHASDVTFRGRLTGNGGTLTTSSFANYQRFPADEFAFNGKAKANSSGTGFLLTPKRMTGSLTSLTCSGCLGNYQFYTSYAACGLLFGPAANAPACDNELYIGEVSGSASVNRDTKGKLWRNGGQIVVWGSNTVHAGTVNSSVHVIGNRKDQDVTSSFFGSQNCFGTGNFIADTVNDKVSLFLGTNVYVTVGKAAGQATFDYTYHSNTINRMTLDITNSCATTAKVKATDLGMLPARLSGFKGTVSLTDATVGKAWEIPVDFSKGPAALYQTVGCIGSGTLAAAPATGTINVTFPTDGTFAPGEYSIARFASGGEKLAGWTVTLNGQAVQSLAVGSDYVMRVHKDATGIWLKVSVPGLSVIIR